MIKTHFEIITNEYEMLLPPNPALKALLREAIDLEVKERMPDAHTLTRAYARMPKMRHNAESTIRQKGFDKYGFDTKDTFKAIRALEREIKREVVN